MTKQTYRVTCPNGVALTVRADSAAGIAANIDAYIEMSQTFHTPPTNETGSVTTASGCTIRQVV